MSFQHLSEPDFNKWLDFYRKAEELFPFIIIHQGAPASNLLLIRQMQAGHAQIITRQGKLNSLYTLKVHFTKTRQFTYRSDKFPGDAKTQYNRLLKLAERIKNTSKTLCLYDNSRAKPDDLLIKWINGKIVEQNNPPTFPPPPTYEQLIKLNQTAKQLFKQ